MSLEDDLFDVGESIETLINHAISSQDFQQLNQKISETIHNYTNSMNTNRRPNYQDPLRNSYGRNISQTINQQMWPASRQALERQRFNNVSNQALKSTLQKIVGGGMLGIFGPVTLAFLPDILLGIDVGASIAAGVFCGALAFAGFNMLRKGIRTGKRINLFKKVKNILGTREYVDIAELVARTNMDRIKLLEELSGMLSDGYFRMGHLDRQGTCLMVTDQVYGQYQQLEAQQRMQREEAAREEAIRRSQAEESGITPEYQQMMDSCQNYINMIHQCNIDLPGEEITRKLNRLEAVVTRIVDEARKNPKKTTELHKFMDYYMPTTWKLLDAYRTFEREPIQSANIVNTKREIESSLDTINEAYEKLLNDLFQATAWDISSDISVLTSMLAQEGLTGSDFDKMKEAASTGETVASGGTMLHF